MSTAFISPANATWQELLAGDSPYLNEITLAYSERRQAINQSVYTPSDGKDVQAVVYWTALQGWLEANCTAFIDHLNGPLNGDQTAFLYFTLATMRAAADLNAFGFRRVPEGVEWDGITDPVWSYGQMQAGDIIGPWIFEDLQKVFGALKWTQKTSVANRSQSKSAVGNTETSCVANLALYNSNWSTATWSAEIEYQYFHYVDVAQGTHSGSYDGFVASRQKGKAAISDIPTINPCVADIYLVPASHPFGSGTFYDVDSTGLPEGVFFLSETLVESSDAARIGTIEYGNIETSPVSLMGWTCPTVQRHVYYGYNASYWLLKWNFSNA